MARADVEWVGDIISANADIRADTAGMDLAAFSAQPVIVRSVLYSIAITRDRIVHECFRTNTRRIWDVVVDNIDALEDALRPKLSRPLSAPGPGVSGSRMPRSPENARNCNHHSQCGGQSGSRRPVSRAGWDK